MDVAAVVESALGRRVVSTRPIGGGAAGRVERLWLESGETIIAKHAERLDREARSLNLLADRSHLPVPEVLHVEPGLLLMSDLSVGSAEAPIEGSLDAQAAAHLASLHAVVSPDGRYGLDFDNLIGPLAQCNTPSESWPRFFGDCRIVNMARAAEIEGVLASATVSRLERLTSRLDQLLPDRPAASLIHGDIWSGNVITRGERILGFIDPAPYYAHAEVELAFITMFSTFGRDFFEAYSRHLPIDPDFRRARRDVYLLYPLLTHVRIYRGGGYESQIAATLTRLGF